VKLSTGRWLVLVLIGLGILAAVGLGLVVLLLGRGPGTGRLPQLTPADKRELIVQKNIALGYLENNEYDKAAPLLRTLTQQLPQEPGMVRNYLIALYRPNDAGDPGQNDPGAIAELVQVSERMVMLEPSQPAAHVLAARVYVFLAARARAEEAQFAAYRQRAREHLQKAMDLAPQDPSPAYEMFARIEQELGGETGPAARQALEQAYKREPDNLVIALDWAILLAETDDAQAGPVVRRLLTALPSSLPPPAEEVLGHLRKLIEQPAQAISRRELYRRLLALRNSLQTHARYRQDRSRVLPHPLAFVEADFSPSFYQDLHEEPEPGIPVTWRPVSLDMPPQVGQLGDAVLADLDHSGQPHLVLLSQHEGRLYLHTLTLQGRQTMPSLELPMGLERLHLADLDFDIEPGQGPGGTNLPADLDALLYGPKGLMLLENQRAGAQRRWVDRTPHTGLPAIEDVRWLVVCDLDHDGNLDLVVGTPAGTRLFRNHGDWSFTEITALSPQVAHLSATAAAFGDFDRDGVLDLILAQHDGQLLVAHNERGGRFTVQKAGQVPESVRSLVVDDINNDGHLDVLAAGAGGWYYLLGSTAGLAPPIRGADRPTADLLLTDFDNDGWLDVVALVHKEHVQEIAVYRNLGGQSFSQVHGVPAPDACRRLQVYDTDRDGDEDLLCFASRAVHVLQNDGGNRHHWLDIRLQALLVRDEGTGQGARCNLVNIGGTLELKAGLHYQMRLVRRETTHFGLGRRRADTVRVLWTNGVPQVLIRPAPDQTITEPQLPKGSCPFLFAWDGERFSFVTDCLWTSALGMQLAPGIFMDAGKQDNHLVIRPHQLRPCDGLYQLRFTNELWEIPYLDHVELWYVDHPVGTEVYTNRRIPPGVEPLEVVCVGHKHYPRSATDHRGKDWRQAVMQADRVCVGGFRRQRYIGLAEPHWLELDFGEFPGQERAWLCCTGWVWPTDTTANLAIARDRRFRGRGQTLGGATPPQLHIPDGRGGWRVADQNIGFPAGKLQTVVVPLDRSLFPRAECRVRLATGMELYWDEIFLADTVLRVTDKIAKLPLQRAHLRYRGFSRIVQTERSSPHLPDYADCDPALRWLPIPGRFTRPGDVTQLLHADDGYYVVMAPGDELALEFAASQPPAPGMQRTFIFYASGWLKDCDFNTLGSASVEPLPYHGMTFYPYDPTTLPPAQRELLDRLRREYLTRSHP